MPRCLAIIQARCGSSRLPNKVFADISGQPMLFHVLQRTQQAKRLDGVVLATTTETADDRLQAFAASQGTPCYRGSEQDVLDRIYRAASEFDADPIVRVTSDCPLVDPGVIDQVLEKLDQGFDYASNGLRLTYPDGIDVEAFRFATLEKTWREASRPSDREHVTPYMRHSGAFLLGGIEYARDLSQYRWSVDRPPDLAFVQAVFAHLYQPGTVFSMEEIVALLEQKPALLHINQSIARNEGYYLSIARENASAPVRQQDFTRSKALLARARAVIPGATQTLSKGAGQFVQGVCPMFIDHGAGSHVWDVDGNEYIDYISALGAVSLGYNFPAVTQAVTEQLQRGISFSLPHALETEVAELLVEFVPSAERVRFCKNGSDATTGAVRLARAFTGRDLIACSGYHGWHDWFIGTTSLKSGIPKATQDLTHAFPYNDIDALERLLAAHPGQFACVIMEPCTSTPPQDGFLEKVRELTRAHQTLLIFDEVVTGFRIALGGAQQHFGVTPDLTCLGKALANGLPLSALVGRADIMDTLDKVFFSFTFGGETASLAAALATLRVMQREHVAERLWSQGQRLQDGYNIFCQHLGIAEHTQCVGFAPSPAVTFPHANAAQARVLRCLLQQELAKRGVLFLSAFVINFSHTEVDIEQTLRVLRQALGVLADALASGAPETFLEGPVTEDIWRQR